jgi:hypothetical protein
VNVANPGGGRGWLWVSCGEGQRASAATGTPATFGGGTVHQLVAPVVLHKLVELRPGNEFQNVAKHRIRIGHGADPFHVQLSRKTLDTIRINAVRFAQQKSGRTAVDLIRVSIHLHNKFFRRRWITGSSPVTTISDGLPAMRRIRAAGWAKRSVPTIILCRKVVGTAQVRLCPPYENVAATLPSPESSIATLSPALSQIVLTRLPVSTISPARRALPSEAR